MIRLGGRLAVSGGREAIVRLVLTAIGVGIGTTLLLAAASADPAIRAHQQRDAWQFTGDDDADLRGPGDALLWSLAEDAVDGRELLVLRVAAAGPGAPAPLGLAAVPAPGEVFVSPALARLLDDLPADRLADRFPSAPAGMIDRRFLGGPDALVAVVGLSEDALRSQPDVLEVHHIRTAAVSFQFTDVLRLVLGLGAVALLLPVIVFVGTSTRLGAARRERRFAALRLAGATPRQTTILAAVEAGAAAAVGAALGGLGFLLLRSRVAHIEIDGHPSFPDDVRVVPAILVLILVAVPLLSVLAAMASLRRLQISPLGVASRAVRAQPTARRLIPLAAGAVGFVVSLGLATGTQSGALLLLVLATFALMIYGIVAAGPWLTVLAARAISRTGRRASALLAGRRLEDDPAAGFRAVSGLVLAVFVASVFSGVTPAFLEDNRSGAGGLVQGPTMAATLPTGTTTASASAALAAAAAAGAGPGGVLHEDPDPGRPLSDPANGRGTTLIVACAGVAFLDLSGPCPDGGTAWVDLDSDRRVVEAAPFSVAEIEALPAERIVVATDGLTATTDRVRTAIERALPGAAPLLGSEAESEANGRLIQLNRLANLALTVTLVVAGCGLAVAVAGGIIERQRPFTLLRLAGMHLAELRRVAMLEAAAPLLLIASASALLGLATSAVIVETSGLTWAPPTIGYWLSLAGGLAVALGVAAATLPLLGRATAPSAVRFE